MEQLHIQVVYLKMLGARLERFRETGTFLFNCRCPICGDSQKSLTKSRGYFYRSPTTGLMGYQCHNCGVSKSFRKFLEYVDAGLAKQYRIETFKSAKGDHVVEKVVVEKTSLSRKLENADCTQVTKLSRTHISNMYLRKRKIPSDKFSEFFFTENLRRFCSSMGLSFEVPEDPRLLLFECDKFGHIKIIVARSLNPNSTQRYVTLRLDDDYPKLFGYSRVQKNNPVLICEGAIDSLFLNNGCASLDSNLDGHLKYDVDFKDVTYIVDNEPRNTAVSRKLKQLIESGKKVVIFPITSVQKDINDFVRDGFDIHELIKKCSCHGIKAKMQYRMWNKC